MSIQLRITHTTGFEYGGSAVASYNQARLTPVTTADQIVVHSRLEIAPKPWTFEYRDYFGAAVTAFEVVDPHDSMTVTAISTVQTNRAEAAEPTSTWEQLAHPDVSDRWTEYLTLPEVVDPPADFAQRAKQVVADFELPGEAARDLCALVHDEVELVTDPTGGASSAAAAWAQRAGAGQDLVHLIIGGLRSVGIPARFVAGYVHPSAEPVIGETVTTDPHAWVEWWDDGWQAFDVAHNHVPCDRYVEVATGRDYGDVKPISGIYAGAETTRISVDVEIIRLA